MYIYMNKNLLLLVLVLIGFNISAQDKKTETITAPAEAAPAAAPKKKVSTSGSNTNPWEIGISGGLNYVWGDVSSRVKLDLNNSTFGIHIRKALSNNFSWRWQYNMGIATMADFRPHYTAVVNGLSTNPNNNVWFVSSQMYSHSLSWDQVLTVGNSGMKKMNPKWTLDLFAGPAIFLYQTNLDRQNDATGQQYNWNQLLQVYNSALGQSPNNFTGDQRAKRLVAEAMDNIMDGKYEQNSAANNGGKSTIGGYAIVPAAAFGASVNRKLTNRFSASLEHRIFYVFDDYLDGERFANNFQTSPSYSQMNDMVHQTTVKLNYNLGKGTAAPLYWRNSNEELQKKLAEMNPRKEINAAFADDDGDGVPNILDQEPSSREGCPVDTKGVMLDSDKDGLIDCDDKEPYSPAGYPVDNQGVAKVPPPACCADITKAAATQVKSAKPAGDCSEVTLPSVTFEKDKYGLNSNSAVSLQSIGEKMQKCPDMKLVVNGINDRNNKNGKYNEQLSYNRAMEVANYLEERFGLSRDRFIVRYNLEGTGDADADRAVMFRNAQEGESGANNPPSPHPGLKAGQK
jgi:outer membrane protein OmpA-like peptidoglycan-associated protein